MEEQKLSRFEELHNSLKGTTNEEILKDIQDRIWQINMIDRWQPQDWQDYRILVELEYIYRNIEREDRENGKK